MIGEMNEVVELRRRAGMTQAALARAAGVPQTDVAAYETGARRPSRTTWEWIRAAAQSRLSTVLGEHLNEAKRIVGRHKATDLRVPGFVARGTDRAGSDQEQVRFARPRDHAGARAGVPVHRATRWHCPGDSVDRARYVGRQHLLWRTPCPSK